MNDLKPALQLLLIAGGRFSVCPCLTTLRPAPLWSLDRKG